MKSHTSTVLENNSKVLCSTFSISCYWMLLLFLSHVIFKSNKKIKYFDPSHWSQFYSRISAPNIIYKIRIFNSIFLTCNTPCNCALKGEISILLLLHNISDSNTVFTMFTYSTILLSRLVTFSNFLQKKQQHTVFSSSSISYNTKELFTCSCINNDGPLI